MLWLEPSPLALTLNNLPENDQPLGQHHRHRSLMPNYTLPMNKSFTCYGVHPILDDQTFTRAQTLTPTKHSFVSFNQVKDDEVPEVVPTTSDLQPMQKNFPPDAKSTKPELTDRPAVRFKVTTPHRYKEVDIFLSVPCQRTSGAATSVADGVHQTYKTDNQNNTSYALMRRGLGFQTSITCTPSVLSCPRKLVLFHLTNSRFLPTVVLPSTTVIDLHPQRHPSSNASLRGASPYLISPGSFVHPTSRMFFFPLLLRYPSRPHWRTFAI